MHSRCLNSTLEVRVFCLSPSLRQTVTDDVYSDDRDRSHWWRTRRDTGWLYKHDVCFMRKICRKSLNLQQQFFSVHCAAVFMLAKVKTFDEYFRIHQLTSIKRWQLLNSLASAAWKRCFYSFYSEYTEWWHVILLSVCVCGACVIYFSVSAWVERIQIEIWQTWSEIKSWEIGNE